MPGRKVAELHCPELPRPDILPGTVRFGTVGLMSHGSSCLPCFEFGFVLLEAENILLHLCFRRLSLQPLR